MLRPDEQDIYQIFDRIFDAGERCEECPYERITHESHGFQDGIGEVFRECVTEDAPEKCPGVHDVLDEGKEL